MSKPKCNEIGKADRIENHRIVLNGQGAFPKELIIVEPRKTLRYRLIRTQYGKYQLTR